MEFSAKQIAEFVGGKVEGDELATVNSFAKIEEGKKIAEETYERHTFFSEMLQNIGVPKNIATEDACRIEHVISQESFEAIKKYYQNNKD